MGLTAQTPPILYAARTYSIDTGNLICSTDIQYGHFHSVIYRTYITFVFTDTSIITCSTCRLTVYCIIIYESDPTCNELRFSALTYSNWVLLKKVGSSCNETDLSEFGKSLFQLFSATEHKLWKHTVKLFFLESDPARAAAYLLYKAIMGLNVYWTHSCKGSQQAGSWFFY